MRIVGALVVALLVIPTLAVTTARLMPGGSLLWVVLRACAPMAIIPYAIASIVLAVIAWGLRGVSRSVTVATLVAVMSLTTLHVWWFTEPFLADAPGSASGNRFTVMTANLHIGRADPATVLDAVDRHDVDVLVLEEITPSALAALDDAGLDARLGNRAGSAQTGRDGIMVFANQSLREVGQIASATPGYVVEMATGCDTLRILAVHPTAPNNGVAQWSDDLDAVVEAAQASSGPTVVVGDFNATLDHPQIRALLGLDYRDAGVDAGLVWQPTWPSPRSVEIRGIRVPSLFGLDHVFARGPLEATHASTHVIPGTDHRALVTAISWTDSAAPDSRQAACSKSPLVPVSDLFHKKMAR